MEPVLKYKFDDFEADLKAAELRRNGTRLKLQMQPFQVLVALLERPKDVVTREELRQRLWPEDTFVDFDHGLNTAMAKLRDVLGDSAAKPKYVETIAKRGYRFLGEAIAIHDQPKTAATAPPVNTGTPAGTPAIETRSTEPPVVAAVPPSVHETDLPRASRGATRLLFTLCQIIYLVFYLCALFRLDELSLSCERAWGRVGHVAFIVYLVTALVGLAVRLYLMTATAFDYHLLAEKYRILFPALFLLDMLWALSPFLIADRIGLGLALGATAALIYLPFAQRVLIKMIGNRTVTQAAIDPRA